MAKVTFNLFTFVYVCFQNSKGIQRFNKQGNLLLRRNSKLHVSGPVLDNCSLVIMFGHN